MGDTTKQQFALINSITDKAPFQLDPPSVPAKNKNVWSQERAKSRIKTLTSKDRKKLKLFEIPKESISYDGFLPIHHLWKDYMQDTVGHFDPSSKELGEALIKADYHGAILKVIRATCVTRVGLSGIVIMETQETFKIVTLDNLLKVIPKKNTVFTFELQYIRGGSKSKKI